VDDQRKGFTLIEAIVAMGIMAVVLAFGTTGVVRFRNSVELVNGYSDMQSIIRTLQNRARNSTTTSVGNLENNVPIIPDYYGLKIEDSNYSVYECFENNTLESVNCNETESDLKATKLSNILYHYNCYIIGFRRASTEIISINDTGIINNIDSCVIDVLHKNSDSDKSITINLEDNNIETND
jgi:prepilin-type N-terminal cleavage/methylation domain-containing protein